VTGQALHHGNIRTTVEEMCAKRASEVVWAERENAGLRGALRDLE